MIMTMIMIMAYDYGLWLWEAAFALELNHSVQSVYFTFDAFWMHFIINDLSCLMLEILNVYVKHLVVDWSSHSKKSLTIVAVMELSFSNSLTKLRNLVINDYSDEWRHIGTLPINYFHRLHTIIFMRLTLNITGWLFYRQLSCCFAGWYAIPKHKRLYLLYCCTT